MEIRLLLAFLLMGGVLFLTPYIYKPSPQPKAPAQPAATATESTASKAPADTAPAAARATDKPAIPALPQQSGRKEELVTIDTVLYRIVFSNRGAVVRSWTLKKYKDSAGKPLELVDASIFDQVGAPFSLVFAGAKPAVDLNAALFAMQSTDGGLGVDFTFSDGSVSCRKSFHFERDSYLSKVATEVTANGAPVPHLISWRGGFGDATVLNASTAQRSIFYDLTDSKLREKTAKDAKKGTLSDRGSYSFAGLEDSYFVAVFLPAENTNVQIDTYADNLPRGPEKKQDLHVGVAVGGDAANRFSLFAGPKDVDLLNTINPRLKQLIDWGWFGIIAKPLFLAMKVVNNDWIHNWGWTIVFITIVTNLLLLPLRFTSMKSAKKMQALQPLIAAINAKYKNVSMRDPKNAEKNQEVMDLYKKHGVNPMGGCLPMLIQLPLLYAFYRVLAVVIELRGAPWLWVSDLSQPEHLPIRLLPTIMIVTQFLVQKMTPNPSTDPNQQKMMLLMPLAFGFFFYYQSSGLVLYYLTSNLVSIVTQWMVNRAIPPVAIPAPKAVVKKASRA